MRKKSKRTKGIEEAHPFSGMSRIHPNAAGVDIGAIEIVACVPGDGNTQIVKAFGNYTVDQQALAQWMKATTSKRLQWKVQVCIGSPCSKSWNARALNTC